MLTIVFSLIFGCFKLNLFRVKFEKVCFCFFFVNFSTDVIDPSQCLHFS